MKTCAWCKAHKGDTEFSPHKRNRDGLHSYCRSCVNQRLRDKMNNDPSAKEAEKVRWRNKYRAKKGIPLDIPAISMKKWGEGHINKHGYKYFSDKKNGGNKKFEHRRIMEVHIGRKLEEFEHIHHKNGDKLDNRINNLEIWDTRTKWHPRGCRVSDLLEDAKEFLTKQGYDVVKR